MSPNFKRADALPTCLLVVLIMAVFVSSMNAMSIEQANSKIEAANLEEQLATGIPKHKFIVMPSSLTRFLFYNTKPYERLSANSIFDNKRSNSALDMITGVTLGKRSLAGGNGNGFVSPSSVDLVNWEPIFGRQQYGLNGMPRIYDLRWMPTDAYESSSSSGSGSSSSPSSSSAE